MSKTSIRPMIDIALLATIAYILDLVTQPISLGPWISLSFKMVPIFLLSFRWGLKPVLWEALSGASPSGDGTSSRWLANINTRFSGVFCRL